MPSSFFERGFSHLTNLTSLTVLEQRFEDYLRARTEESALVLTSHLHLERLVHEIHSRYFGRHFGDRIFERAGFSTARQLLNATNIVKPAISEGLRYVNEIRNGFAHSETTLASELKKLDQGRAFRNSCSALNVARINSSSERDLFIRWSAKLYVELTKSKYIASEMNNAMMTTSFVDLFRDIDLTDALTDPSNQF